MFLLVSPTIIIGSESNRTNRNTKEVLSMIHIIDLHLFNVIVIILVIICNARHTHKENAALTHACTNTHTHKHCITHYAMIM